MNRLTTEDGSRVFDAGVYGLWCNCASCAIDKPHLIRYVGQSKSIDMRMKQHYGGAIYGSEHPLYRWMRKHKLENIVYDVLHLVDVYDERLVLEIQYIEVLNTYIGASNSIGFNLTIGGEGCVGAIYSEEQRKAKGERSKEIWQRPGYYDRWLEATRETRESPEFRAQLSEAIKPWWTEERRHQRSIDITAKWKTDEYRQKVVNAGKVGCNSDAEIQRRKNTARKLWQDPAYADKVRHASVEGLKRLPKEHFVSKGKYAMHVRWHVNRSVVSTDCDFCA